MDTPIFDKKNVIVTGGAGFIGSHLCERLLKEAKVICLDDFSNSSSQNINHLLQYPDFEFIKHDVTRPFDLSQFEELDKFKVKFQGIQEIYHLACPTSPKNFEATRIDTIRANSLAMLNTLEQAVKFKAKYLFTSSAVVYGDDVGERNALKESDQGAVNQLSSRACYDEGKRFAETCVATYAAVHGLDVKIARVFTTYGPRLSLFDGQLISGFILNALNGQDLVIYGGQDFSTSLCFVTDMVDGLVRLMDADKPVMTANFGGESAIKYAEVAKQIIAMTGSSSRVVFEKPHVFLSRKGTPDVHLAKESLGWLPLVRLEDGLRKTIDFVIANREALSLGNEQGK